MNYKFRDSTKSFQKAKPTYTPTKTVNFKRKAIPQFPALFPVLDVTSERPNQSVFTVVLLHILLIVIEPLTSCLSSFTICISFVNHQFLPLFSIIFYLLIGRSPLHNREFLCYKCYNYFSVYLSILFLSYRSLKTLNVIIPANLFLYIISLFCLLLTRKAFPTSRL